MKCASVAEWKGHRNPTGHLYPREGSRMRELYDQFMANKGVPISSLDFRRGDWRRLDALRDFYGLDIRHIRKGRWCLVGEWFGSTYIDYVARHLAKLERNQQ